MDYWNNICELQKRQNRKGMEKYGQPLEDNNGLDMRKRLEMLEEELIDGLMYIEHIKALVSQNFPENKKDQNPYLGTEVVKLDIAGKEYTAIMEKWSLYPRRGGRRFVRKYHFPDGIDEHIQKWFYNFMYLDITCNGNYTSRCYLSDENTLIELYWSAE